MNFDEKFETGVLWQDFQHKQLIDLFGKVKQAKAEQKDESLFRYTIAFLAMYVNHHFKLEEEYMEKYKYPDRKTHAQEHHDFIIELKEFRNDNKVYSQRASDDLIMRMGEWILSHILENDKKLGKHILDWEAKHGIS